MEFDPTSPSSQVNYPARNNDARPLMERASDPYLTYQAAYDFSHPYQTEASIEGSTGFAYDCLSMHGLSQMVDFNFVMSPGKPQDLGSNNPLARLSTGVYNQSRTVVSSLDMAGTAPYEGIYTGLTGYLESQQ